jgi:hypothetical protein
MQRGYNFLSHLFEEIVTLRISRRAALVIIGGIGAALLALGSRFADVRRAVQRALNPAPKPAIVSRAEWGAEPPDHNAPNEFGITDDPTDPAWHVYTKPLDQVYNTVAIHHTAALLFSNETMRDVQKLHMETNGWADVGYHYAIDRSGIVYEGRDVHVRGASVAGHNTGVLGIVLMGDFEFDQPLDVQLASAQTLVNWLASEYPLTHLAGHGEFNPETSCPGRNLKAQLDMLAEKAGLQRGTRGYVPP